MIEIQVLILCGVAFWMCLAVIISWFKPDLFKDIDYYIIQKLRVRYFNQAIKEDKPCPFCGGSRGVRTTFGTQLPCSDCGKPEATGEVISIKRR